MCLEKKQYCPRCGKQFVCNHPQSCWCEEISLPPFKLQHIQQQWQGCLCPACLQSVAEEKSIEDHLSF